MKKLVSLFAALISLIIVLTACSSKTENKESSDKSKEPTVLKVASHTAPMTDMLEMVKEDLLKDGYKLELVKVSDNVQANVALNNKEVDANFFQHKPFMEQFNKKNNANLVAVQTIYSAPVAFYSKNITDIKDLKDGSDVAIPSDPTNMARALRLLQQGNLIKLKDSNSYEVTVEDVIENPKNLKFTPVGLLNLNEAYQEKDLIFNYPAYAAKINLNPAKNGLLVEKTDDLTFAISVVAREDNKNSDAVKALSKALTSDKIKNYINDKLKDQAIVAF